MNSVECFRSAQHGSSTATKQSSEADLAVDYYDDGADATGEATDLVKSHCASNLLLNDVVLFILKRLDSFDRGLH